MVQALGSFRAEPDSTMASAAAAKSSNITSLSMDQRTNHWIHYQDFPPDVVVEVGQTSFALHKFILVSKSNHIRKLVMDSKERDLNRIDLSDIPGGPETFEKAAKFCYGFNFEITLDNVAALRCAAEYLQMTDNYCDNNLAGRTEDFLTQVAFSGFSGSITVLKSCEVLLPMAEDLKIVDGCINVATFKAHREESFPTRSPPYWWAEQLPTLNVTFFGRIINSMKQRGATAKTLAAAITIYTEKTLKNRNNISDMTRNRDLVESIVALLPSDVTVFPVNFLCCLLQSTIFAKASADCVKELEKRISVLMEHVTVNDLLLLSFSHDGERLLDLESVRNIVSVYVEKERSVAIFSASDFAEVYSTGLQKVTKTVDVYLSEIAICNELSISKFNAIAGLVPKGARKLDDDLYRAIDIYLKAHPNLDEVGREKLCGAMDPRKLSYEARAHASKNNRIPAKIVLRALYYNDQPDNNIISSNESSKTRSQVLADVSLVKENDDLRSELMMMKTFVTQMQQKNNQGATSSAKVGPKRPTLFSSVSKQLGRLNPFRNVSKDTSNIVDESVVDVKKPRRRRFSIS